MILPIVVCRFFSRSMTIHCKLKSIQLDHSSSHLTLHLKVFSKHHMSTCCFLPFQSGFYGYWGSMTRKQLGTSWELVRRIYKELLTHKSQASFQDSTNISFKTEDICISCFQNKSKCAFFLQILNFRTSYLQRWNRAWL